MPARLPTDADPNVTGHDRQNGDAVIAELTGAKLFALLWDALADVLGTAATAALLRRAVRQAMGRFPELAALIIVREKLKYRYTLPSAWSESSAPPAALHELAKELRPLLIELTGSVVVRHLDQIPELREHGFGFLAEEKQS